MWTDHRTSALRFCPDISTTSLTRTHYTHKTMATQSANETKVARYTHTDGETYNLFSDATKSFATNNNGSAYIRRVVVDRDS